MTPRRRYKHSFLDVPFCFERVDGNDELVVDWVQYGAMSRYSSKFTCMVILCDSCRVWRDVGRRNVVWGNDLNRRRTTCNTWGSFEINRRFCAFVPSLDGLRTNINERIDEFDCEKNSLYRYKLNIEMVLIMLPIDKNEQAFLKNKYL